MARTIFITGGARSGKSAFAEQLAQGFGAPLCYLATARALDGEMGERILQHRKRRGEAWLTIEEPLLPDRELSRIDGKAGAVLVDCVTLWLTNLLFHYGEAMPGLEGRIMEDVQRLATVLSGMTTPVILVSNEVGMGIVPDNALARSFRDMAGRANQILATAADEAWLVASGIPLRLK